MIIITEETNTIIPDYISFTVYLNIEIPGNIYVMNMISGWVYLFNNWEEVKARFSFITDKVINKINSTGEVVTIEYWIKENKINFFRGG